MSTDRPKDPSSLRRHWPKLVLSLLIAAAFVWLLQRGALPLVPPAEAFAATDWWLVGVLAAFYGVVLTVRASRWYFLLAAVEPVPVSTVLRTSYIAFAAITIMPFRMGEVVRPLMIRREGKLTAWAASGTVGAERVVDGLSISALLLLSLSLAAPVDPLPDHIGDLPVPAKLVPGAAYVTVLVFLAAFSLMGLFYWRREWARLATRTVLGLVSVKLADWVAGRVEQVADGLVFLKEPRYSAPFFLGTALYWFLSGVWWWLAGKAVGLESFTLLQAVATMGVVALGILAPNAPGFFGAFQLSIYAGLAMYLAPEAVVARGSVYVFLVYVIQISVTLTLGAVGLLVRPALSPVPASGRADAQ